MTTPRTSIENPGVKDGVFYRLTCVGSGEIRECADILPLLRILVREMPSWPQLLSDPDFQAQYRLETFRP